MKNKFQLIELEINHMFTADLFLDDDLLLLSPFEIFDQPLMERLMKWKMVEVFSDGEYKEVKIEEKVTDLSIKPNDEFLSYDEKNFEKDTLVHINRWIKSLEKIFVSRDKNAQIIGVGSVSPGRTTEIVSDFIDYTTKAKNEEMLNIILMSIPKNNNSYFLYVAIKTCILVLVLGSRLKLTRFMLLELGCAALIQDVGIISSNGGIFRGFEDDVQDENLKKLSKLHPALGYKILERCGFTPSICSYVLNSHENTAGTGYPRNIKSDQLSLSSKILSFCNLIIDKIEKNNYKIDFNKDSEICKLLYNEDGICYKEVAKLFSKIFNLYYPGCYLKLNDNSVCLLTSLKFGYKKLIVVPLVDYTTKETIEQPQNIKNKLSNNIELNDFSKIDFMLQKDEYIEYIEENTLYKKENI